MILSVNPKKTTELVSIPRDTQAEIVGRGTTEKLIMLTLMGAYHGC